jgi:CTP synthase
MQLAIIEYARNVVGLEGAHTTEIDPDTPHPIIDVMAGQKDNLADSNYGGTMRLGSYPATLKSGTLAAEAYGETEISERHRHRFEVNNEYVEKLEEAGLVFSGQSPDGHLMEIAELPTDEHPFFLGTQFHPEFTAQVLESQPLFDAFIQACKTT